MQLFINNWSTVLTVQATASAVQLSVEPAEAAKLVGLGAGNFYLLTLAELDSVREIDWEIVKVTATAGGELAVERSQGGTAARLWLAGAPISARLTAQSMIALSDAAPLPLAAVATPGAAAAGARADHQHALPAPADIGAATAAQGAKADSAVQPADLAAVATSGAYADLIGTPAIPSTPAEVGAATAAQGAKADTAVQPGALAAVATTGAYADLVGKPAIPASASEVGAIAASEKGAVNGVATLGGDQKIPLAQLPATAITSTFVVNSQAAMLALTAEEGDVAIRPDINTSFILGASPASTLANWQELLSPAAGGGASVGSATPQPLGAATPGVSAAASRQDHVHEMPSATAVGAATPAQLTAGLADKVDKVAGKGLSTEDYSTAEKSKLAGIAAGATANSADAALLARGNHTGTQSASTISDLVEVTQDMVGAMIVAGSNVSVTYNDAAGTLTISSSAGGDVLAQLLSAEVAVTGAVTLTASAFGKMHVCSGTSADYTVVLPAVSGNAGKFIGFHMASGLTKLVTIDGNASELIDGAATRVMWEFEAAILFCDGATWTKVAGKFRPMEAQIRAAVGSAQSIPSSVSTVVTLNVVDYDIGGLNPTANQFNVRRVGDYFIRGHAEWNPGAAPRLNTAIYVAGSANFYDVVEDAGSANHYPRQSPTYLGTLAAGAAANVQCYHTLGSAIALVSTVLAQCAKLTITELQTW